MPTVLDLFCGVGGASAGYAQAGYDVVGVDLHPQPRYPFDFHQADALTYPLDGFDLIHASPPCQRYSAMTKRWQREGDHPDLIAAVRERLGDSGTPWIIENVPGSPLVNPITLCGSMFPELVCDGQQLRRHRRFESSLPLVVEMSCHHVGTPLGGYGHGGGLVNPGKGCLASAGQARELMGIPWATRDKLAQAIPPAYTAYLGKQALSLSTPT
jgi:DNA (cytosine-5)-methyltransferase 1